MTWIIFDIHLKTPIRQPAATATGFWILLGLGWPWVASCHPEHSPGAVHVAAGASPLCLPLDNTSARNSTYLFAFAYYVCLCVCECIILYTQRGGCYLYTYACNYVYAHMINMFTDGAHSVLCNQTVLYPSLILHMHTYPRW